ncbi:MAG: adenylyltransferase/cytidyltransferase family protein [Bdellovibrionales bacterium]|nr:adenylyltransferase/cytidyltransferase family protein [Bdellovibrionales bacterium]
MTSEKRIMVDMSVTLLHHGHIRLLKKAKELGRVVVALTSDEEIEKKKGYKPELSFEERKEVLLALKYVDEVVKSPWLIEESFLDQHGIDQLVHGHDNSNEISKDRLVIFPRTEGVSSDELRNRSYEIIAARKE